MYESLVIIYGRLFSSYSHCLNICMTFVSGLYILDAILKIYFLIKTYNPIVQELFR